MVHTNKACKPSQRWILLVNLGSLVWTRLKTVCFDYDLEFVVQQLIPNSQVITSSSQTPHDFPKQTPQLDSVRISQIVKNYYLRFGVYIRIQFTITNCEKFLSKIWCAYTFYNYISLNTSQLGEFHHLLKRGCFEAIL